MLGKKHLLFIKTVALPLIFLGGCVSSKVAYLGLDEDVDLSGRWNDTDSRATAVHLTESLLNGYWLVDYRSETEKKPVLVIGKIQNRTSEHIESQTFTKQIERELVNGGQVTLIASGRVQDALRNEREAQQLNATPETMAALARETGASFMLVGSILSEVDAARGRRITKYTVNLELLNVETGEKVWIDYHEIKKEATRKRYRF